MKRIHYKKVNNTIANQFSCKKIEAISLNEVQEHFNKKKSRNLSQAQCILIKDWLNNFLVLSYKTWKQQEAKQQEAKQQEAKQQEILTTPLSTQTNDTMYEKSHYLYPSKYRRAS
jgi:hypothetical protein